MNKRTGSKLQQTIPVYALLVAGLATGCHSLTESSGGSYKKTTNQDGETVYRRATPAYATPYYPAPTLQPSDPLYITPNKPVASAETATPAAKVSDESSGGSGHLEIARTDGHWHLGVHAGYNVYDWLMPRIGASIFVSKDVYLGFDLSTRFIAPLGYFKPYVGIGGYFGDTKSCSRQSNTTFGYTEEICDKKFLSAGYGEVGVEFGQASIFVRDYRLLRAGLSVPTDMFVGVGLRF